MSSFVARRSQLLGSPGPEGRVHAREFEALYRHRNGAMALTGIGIGLVTFSALLLIHDRVARGDRRVRAAPMGGPGNVGILIQGRF
jgi:hypothetical protein